MLVLRLIQPGRRGIGDQGLNARIPVHQYRIFLYDTGDVAIDFRNGTIRLEVVFPAIVLADLRTQHFQFFVVQIADGQRKRNDAALFVAGDILIRRFIVPLLLLKVLRDSLVKGTGILTL